MEHGITERLSSHTLVNQLRAGNFNAVVPQVRRRGDAFYNSHFEPHATGKTPADFDALGDLIAKAHNTNAGPYIEVHAWLVTAPWTLAATTCSPSIPTTAFSLCNCCPRPPRGVRAD